jgi:WD40 repeat protein
MSLSVLPDQVLAHQTKREDNEILSLLFHPSEQILLAGDVDGCMHFTLFDLDERSVSLPDGMDSKFFTPHKGESCRSMDIPAHASYIVSGGSDSSVAVSNFDPKVVTRYRMKNPVNVVKCLNDGNLILAGDDEGCLIAIDPRMKKNLYTIHEQEDYITSITPSLNGLKSIVCTAGDCTLAVYDLRIMPSTSESSKKRKDQLVSMSDPQEDELSCAIVLNSEQNLITGDANGVVGIWKQGYWGDLKDRLPLYQKCETPQGGMDGSHAIDAMKRIEDKRFLVATSDGIIRTVGLFPNQVERIVGVHRNNDGSEIATISGFDCDVELGLVATAGGDSEGRIKFWSLHGKQQDEPEIPQPKDKKKGKKSKTKKVDVVRNADRASKQEFFNDL